MGVMTENCGDKIKKVEKIVKKYCNCHINMINYVAVE